MNKYWFQAKTYGYGLVPISVEGWIATLGIILVGIFLAYLNNLFNLTNMTILDGIFFSIEVFIAGMIFVKVLEKKSKEKLKWRWGK